MKYNIIILAFMVLTCTTKRDVIQETLSANQVWTSYDVVKSIDEDFADLKAHHIDVAIIKSLGENPVERAKEYLEIARKHGLKLGIRLGNHLLPNAEMVRNEGYTPELGVMIGGVYQGKAIDRYLFEFAAGPQSIIVEPPVYNQTFAYTGKQTGERIAHYFPNPQPPLKAEVIVPLNNFDGEQHIQIIAAKIETVEGNIKLDKESVSEEMPESYEIRERQLYRLDFDLTGFENAILNKVGIAVYWTYKESKEWYVFDWVPVCMMAETTVGAVKSKVEKVLGIWKEANGGIFPDDVLIGLRFGDEPFYLTGHLGSNTPSVNYPLWDFSDTAIKRFNILCGGNIDYPRTWGYPEIYGEEAYSAWMYNLHKTCAEITGIAQQEAKKFSPSIIVFRNTTRHGVFALTNDHDGSNCEMLLQNLDIAHIDPYPVSTTGYNPVIPRDMSYYGGIARRYNKPIVPWMQAHSYVGLNHVSPEDIKKMTQEQWKQGVDGIMWLGYGKGGTFPLTNIASYEQAAELHKKIKNEKPPKPYAKLAVIRSYDAWAQTNYTTDTVLNPNDWLLQQWLEVWSVKHLYPYDAFELAPEKIIPVSDSLKSILKGYEYVVSNIPFENAWFVGENVREKKIPLSQEQMYQDKFEKEIRERGWLEMR